MQITDFFQPKKTKAAEESEEASTTAAEAESEVEVCPPSASPLRIIRELHSQIDAFDETASFSSGKSLDKPLQDQDGGASDQPGDIEKSASAEDRRFNAADTTATAPKPLRTVRSQGNPLNAFPSNAQPRREVRPATPPKASDGKAKLQPGVPVKFDFSMTAETRPPRNMEEAMAIANSSKMAPPVMLPPRQRPKPLNDENDVFSQDFATAAPVKRDAAPAMAPPPVGERANLSATFQSLRSVKSFSTWRKAEVSPESLKRAVSTIRERSPLRKMRGREEYGDRRMSDDSIRPSESMSVCGTNQGQAGADAAVPSRNPIWPVSDEEALRLRLQDTTYGKVQQEKGRGTNTQQRADDATMPQDVGMKDKSIRKKSSRAVLAAQRAGPGSRDSGSQGSRGSSEQLEVPKQRARASQRPGLMDWETFIKEEPAEAATQVEETGHKTKRFFTSMFKKSKKGE
jgi:hypothetical protein